MTDETRMLLAEVEARVAAITGIPSSSKDESPLIINCTPPSSTHPPSPPPHLQPEPLAHTPSDNAAVPRKRTNLESDLTGKRRKGITSQIDVREGHAGGDVEDLRTEPPWETRKVHVGLHVDTHNKPFRLVTMLVYLTSLPEGFTGGHTVFPVARNHQPDQADVRIGKEALQASMDLLDNGVEHTDSALVPMSEEDTDALLTRRGEHANVLLNAAQLGAGVHVPPRMGQAVFFFSRTQDGKVDPRSWHGGARVLKSKPNGDSNDQNHNNSGGDDNKHADNKDDNDNSNDTEDNNDHGNHNGENTEAEERMRILDEWASRIEHTGCKWTMQKFKEIPRAHRHTPEAVSAACATTIQRLAGREGVVLGQTDQLQFVLGPTTLL